MANRWCKGLGEEAKGTDCLGLGLSTLLVSELNISKRLRNSVVWKVYVRGYMKLNQDSAFGREYPSSGLVSLRAWWRSSSGESEYIPYIPKSSLSRREITSTGVQLWVSPQEVLPGWLIGEAEGAGFIHPREEADLQTANANILRGKV